MSTLFWREVRRLVPFAAAQALLGLLVFAGERLAGVRDSWFSATYMVLQFLGLGVLAVAAVAPDKGSGGVAFLSRLPLAPGRVLAIKAGIAASLGAAQVALFTLAFALCRADGPGKAFPTAALVALTSFIFASCLLASILSPRTMPALLAAPFLGVSVWVAGGALLYYALDLYLDIRLAQAFLGVFAVAFAVASWVAFVRGDVHRTSARPGVLAALVLAPVLPLFLVGTARAREWTVEHVTPDLKVGPGDPVTSPDGKLVAVPVVGWLWCGLEERVLVVDAASGESWLVPRRGVDHPIFSPDSRSLLVSADSTGWLVDLGTREARPIACCGRRSSGFPFMSWRDGKPTLPGGGRFIEADDRTENPDLALRGFPAGFTALGVDPRDGRVLGFDARGLGHVQRSRSDPGVFEAAPDAPVFAWPEGRAPGSARLAPSARRLILANRLPGVALETLDLDTGSFTALDVGTLSTRADVIAERARFSPDERRIALDLPTTVSFFDVATGRCLASTPRDRTAYTRAGFSVPSASDPFMRFRAWEPSSAAIWSPDGRFASPHSSLVVDLETGASRTLRQHVAALLPGERCILWGESFATPSVASAVRPDARAGSPEKR